MSWGQLSNVRILLYRKTAEWFLNKSIVKQRTENGETDIIPKGLRFKVLPSATLTPSRLHFVSPLLVSSYLLTSQIICRLEARESHFQLLLDSFAAMMHRLVAMWSSAEVSSMIDQLPSLQASSTFGWIKGLRGSPSQSKLSCSEQSFKVIQSCFWGRFYSAKVF